VLIVDDNPDVLAIVTELVSASGYQALTASGGREAIEKAKAEMPELMLLDINMPDIDGWSVLRSLKEECLERMIFFGETSLRRATVEFLAHYHGERNHQGLDNRLIAGDEDVGRISGAVQCRKRLGGMLRYSHRAAA